MLAHAIFLFLAFFMPPPLDTPGGPIANVTSVPAVYVLEQAPGGPGMVTLS
ncbi:MAG TPA: hypothetical protein VGI19_13615 [Candidatus Cybelea sp.]|jgi:hypothetical protein